MGLPQSIYSLCRQGHPQGHKSWKHENCVTVLERHGKLVEWHLDALADDVCSFSADGDYVVDKKGVKLMQMSDVMFTAIHGLEY